MSSNLSLWLASEDLLGVGRTGVVLLMVGGLTANTLVVASFIRVFTAPLFQRKLKGTTARNLKAKRRGRMLKSITFNEDYRKCFKKGEKLTFIPGVNLLVGDQGTGKSSVFAALATRNTVRPKFKKKGGKQLIEIDCEGETRTMSFDFEKDNLRTRDPRCASIQCQSCLSFLPVHLSRTVWPAGSP